MSQKREAIRVGSGQVAWAVRLSEVWDVGVIVLGADRTIEFTSDRARDLLDCRTDGELAKRWSRLEGQLAPHLGPATRFRHEPAEVMLEVATRRGRLPRAVRCQVFVIDGNGCEGYLLVLQAADQAAAIEASLRQASRSRGLASLNRDTAHDLKGMLNVITLNVELLQRIVEPAVQDVRQRDLAAHCAEALRTELQRIDRVVDVLLDRGTIERSAPAAVDVGAICRNLVDLVAARCRRQRVTATLDGAVKPALVQGFADRLHVALLNLVINALDAMPHGGTLTLRVAVDTEVHVSVSDTGTGLDAAQLEEIWRSDSTTKPGGTGIGLPVVRSVARAHGGRVAYTPNEGGGARFTLHLPLADPG